MIETRANGGQVSTSFSLQYPSCIFEPGLAENGRGSWQLCSQEVESSKVEMRVAGYFVPLFSEFRYSKTSKIRKRYNFFGVSPVGSSVTFPQPALPPTSRYDQTGFFAFRADFDLYLMP